MKAYIDKCPDGECGHGDVNAELFPGIDADLKAFTLFFQPIFNSTSRRMIGAEALARLMMNVLLLANLFATLNHRSGPVFISIRFFIILNRFR